MYNMYDIYIYDIYNIYKIYIYIFCIINIILVLQYIVFMYPRIVRIVKSQLSRKPSFAQYLFNEMHIGISDQFAVQFVFIESSSNRLSARIF